MSPETWPHSAARTGLRSGQGPWVRPGSPSRARACARAPRCPQSWQPAPRSAAAERAPAAASVPGRRGRAAAGACGPPGAKQKADESPRHGAPYPAAAGGRDRAGGEPPGRRARGGAHAGLRAQARGPGGESAARAARPACARRPREEGARRRAPCFPVPSSPGPPYPLPRPDPAAKGWAGKRALWDRCQLRDKRHKIGGNGGSAAGALGRGRRRRGGRILGADPGKFGKSPRRLRSGGGHTGRAALRAALALSAPLLNNSWRGRRPLACTGRAARLCPAAAAAFGAPAALDERPRGGRARVVPALARRPAGPAAFIVPRARAARPSGDRRHPAARPTARRWKFGPAEPGRQPRDARELGESRGARRRGPPLQGVGVPGPARFRFRPGQRSLAAQVADVEIVSCGPLCGEVRSFNTGKPEPGEVEQRGPRRGAGPGEWGLAVRFARAVPELSRPCHELWDMAPLCSLPFRRVKERITWNPRLRPMAEGLCSRGHDSAAPAASGRVPPARAERPCLDWVHSRFLRPNMAGPRAPPRKCTPVVAFKRRSRTTRPGGRCLPCVWVVRQPRRSHPFFPAPWSLADTWSSDDRATLRPLTGS
uniref:Collagen alpha-1(I) chain-like n=1 Tax=Tursiops truncatus TaxID=9739 RepID=A0A6J3S505_TURTR|nr:collagen alpha-1(I) chain-like [Tursiops truncatus]